MSGTDRRLIIVYKRKRQCKIQLNKSYYIKIRYIRRFVGLYFGTEGIRKMKTIILIILLIQLFCVNENNLGLDKEKLTLSGNVEIGSITLSVILFILYHRSPSKFLR